MKNRLANQNNFSHSRCVCRFTVHTINSHWNLLPIQTQIKTSKKCRKSHRINELARSRKRKKKRKSSIRARKQKNSRNAFGNEDQTEAITAITDLELRNGKRRGQTSKRNHWSRLDRTHSGTPARFLRWFFRLVS